MINRSDLLQLLSPQKNEHILDLGCGTGELTAKIAESGAKVIGIDISTCHINEARIFYPNLKFEVMDAMDLKYKEKFDAVFSSSVIHWITTPEKVISSIRNSLKPGGRFVAEFYCEATAKYIIAAIEEFINAKGCSFDIKKDIDWYLPSQSEYQTLLESQGFELSYINNFVSPKSFPYLEDVIETLVEAYITINDNQKKELFLNVQNKLNSKLYKNYQWLVEYQVLRIVAIKEKF